MCGIVGIYLKTKKYEKHLGKFLSGMLDGMATRGPDSAGFAIYTKENKIFSSILFVLIKLKIIILKINYQSL
jgi:glutamate synthase domain-containing protein 1